ncbi:hypothetical protein GOP47_0020449 [Adiantum capillus-veneris]|uniref:Uncharacterized protein n=1 Tax=Adiantum capillus-veneris TaxID=13818 RepID=A0A9D4UAT3_ADICA|nr:hypothetical protein GOP47_0020449 [Adiantum capillus-veneris]
MGNWIWQHTNVKLGNGSRSAAINLAPFYQVKEYYREGTFDNCRSKWGELFDCFQLKTLPEAKSQEILQSREREKMNDHIWQFYTKKEASAAWKRMFGHLDKD